MDISSLRVETIRPGLKSDATAKVMELFQGHDPKLSPAWIANLPALFQQNKLLDIITDSKEAPPHLALALHECGLLATEVLTRNKAGNSPKYAELKRVVEEAAAETRDGTHLAFTRYTVVGRKKE